MLALLGGCSSEKDVYQVKLHSIVTIGDSIGNGFNMAKQPWPNRIQKALDVPLNNNSVSGMETGWGLSVIESELLEHSPSHVLILLGTNDATRGPSIPKAIENMQAMIDLANDKGVIALIGNVIPNTRSPEAEKRALDINERMKTLRGAILVDTRLSFGEGKGLLVDGVHPSDEGQRRIAEAFLSELRRFPR